MLGCKVAIIGAGRMAGLLAHRIPTTCRKVIIGHTKVRAASLADEVGALATDQISAVRGCSVVFLAVPAPVVTQVVQEAAPHLREDTVLVNMALELNTEELTEKFPRLAFAAAKVIGHAGEMSLGSPGVVVIDHVDSAKEALLGSILAGLGTVVRGKESKVMAVHARVLSTLSQAGAQLRRELSDLGLDPAAVSAAITTLGPGLLRSLPDNAGQPPL